MRGGTLDPGYVRPELRQAAHTEALLLALQLHHEETSDHSTRVASYALRIGRAMRVTESYLPILRLGALLHDIGKLRVSPAILDKTTRLTDEEWGILREHPWRGENLLLELGFDKRVCAIVGQNHERDNGTGYPLRLGRFEICLGAQIVAVADTFDAITADRSYRRGEPYEVARDEIVGWAGALFAPSVVGAFERIPQAEWELAH